MLQQIEEPHPEAPPGWPLLRIGLRPFYLRAALAASITVPVWLAVLLGGIAWPAALQMPPLGWHAHEMVYGFASATVIGFLLSASRAWTGLGTTRAQALGLLATLWLAGRLALFVLPYPVYALIDLALLPLVAWVLIRLLLHTGLYRNLPLAIILLLLTLANLSFHLSVLQWLPIPMLAPLHAALALLVLMQCIMAGRVIPGFTISATRGLRIVPRPWLERICLGSTALGLVMWIAASASWSRATTSVLMLAAVSHAVRQWRWRSPVVWRRPVLWILHAAYLWITLGLALLAMAHAGWVAESAAVHAFGVGSTGGLIIGMMTRTARGHTGRSLQTARLELAAYLLVMLAAVLRVLQPLLMRAELSAPLWVAAAGAWSAAFGIYLWIYTPWLVGTRLDGRDG
ncbi:MAG: NnrS family protein [Burkholderiaceae bacterium]